LLAGCRKLAEAEADDTMTLADQALEEENWEKADELFHEIILLDPTRAEAWIGRGMALTHLEPPEEAREHYREALRLYDERLEEEPTSKKAWRRRVMLLVLLNRRDEALVTANEAGLVFSDPEFADELRESVSRIALEYPEAIVPLEDTPESSIP
jgi:tetratricopeptide (TPR) repeat protein